MALRALDPSKYSLHFFLLVPRWISNFGYEDVEKIQRDMEMEKPVIMQKL